MKDTNVPVEERIILDLCGGTGAWSKPYKDAGYNVLVITLPEYSVADWWISGDSIHFRKNESKKDGMQSLSVKIDDIYGVLAAPPCTKFSRAAANIPKKERDFIGGMATIRACLDIIWSIQERNGSSLAFWALENPDGYLQQFLGRPPYSFQPWRFGETDFRATKRTMIWGYFEKPRETVRKRDYLIIPLKGQHSKRKDGSRNSMAPTDWKGRSAKERAETSQLFAQAFFKTNQ